MTPPGRTCPTGKRRFRDSIAAKIALASTQQARHGRRNETRVYRCPSCAGWHLSSKSWTLALRTEDRS
jgi:hypothetical protein